jgi:hypothetical protein
MNLARLNAITATVVSCANSGLSVAAICDKLKAKYGMSDSVSHDLVNAIMAIA